MNRAVIPGPAACFSIEQLAMYFNGAPDPMFGDLVEDHVLQCTRCSHLAEDVAWAAGELAEEQAAPAAQPGVARQEAGDDWRGRAEFAVRLSRSGRQIRLSTQDASEWIRPGSGRELRAPAAAVDVAQPQTLLAALANGSSVRFEVSSALEICVANWPPDGNPPRIVVCPAGAAVPLIHPMEALTRTSFQATVSIPEDAAVVLVV